MLLASGGVPAPGPQAPFRTGYVRIPRSGQTPDIVTSFRHEGVTWQVYSFHPENDYELLSPYKTSADLRVGGSGSFRTVR